MSDTKVRSMRETFKENYKPVRIPARNKKGYKIEYVYIGKWYGWKEDRAVVRHVKAAAAAALILSVLLYLYAALLNVPLNWSKLVSMMGLLSLAPLLFLVIGMVQFLVSREKFTEQDYKDMNVKLHVAPVLHGGLLLACGISGIAEMAGIAETAGIAEMAGGAGMNALPACTGYLLSGAASLMILFIYRRLHHRIIEQ